MIPYLSGVSYQDLIDLISFIGRFLSQIMVIRLPWFNFRFGELIIGPLFLFLLYGVLRLVFTSIPRVGGDDDGGRKT